MLPLFAFNTGKIIAFPLKGFGFQWFYELAKIEALHTAVWTSLKIAIITSVLATVLGMFASRAATRFSFPGKGPIMGLIMVPLVLPEIIVAVACPEMWRTTRKLMLQAFEEQDEVKTPNAAIQYYNKIVPLAYDQGPLGIKGAIKKVVLFFMGLKKPTPRGPASKSDMRTWAHKSTALACQNLMLAFRSYGYDSCPMEGLDENRVHDLLELPGSAKICMAISVGKRAKNGIYGPRIRFDRELFVKTV